MTNVRHNGAFTEYGPSHSKSQSGVNNIRTGGHMLKTRGGHGEGHRMNSIYQHEGRHYGSSIGRNHRHHHNFDRNERYSNYDRYDNYEGNNRPSFGQKVGKFLKGALPFALGIGGALLLGKAGGLGGVVKTVGGFLGKLFGGKKAEGTPEQRNTPPAGSEELKKMEAPKTGLEVPPVKTPAANETKLPGTPAATAPKEGTTPPATTKYEVKAGDSITKIAKAELESKTPGVAISQQQIQERATEIIKNNNLNTYEANFGQKISTGQTIDL